MSRFRTEEENQKAMERAKDMMAQKTLKNHQKNIKNARAVLMVVGVIQLIAAVVYYFAFHSFLDGVIGLVLAGVYAGLYFWSKKELKNALIVGLAVYIVIQVLSVVVFGIETIFQGIIFKIAIVGALVSGLRSIDKIPPQMMGKPENDEILDL